MRGGPLELGAFALLIGIFALGIWAALDAQKATDAQWAAIRQKKATWVRLIAGGTFFVPPVGFIVAVSYLMSVRPKLKAAAGGAQSR